MPAFTKADQIAAPDTVKQRTVPGSIVLAGRKEMPMSLNAFRDEAGAFLKTVDPDSEEPVSEIIRMLDEEYADLKASLDNPDRLSHQIYDMLFLLLELAAKKNVNLDAQWIQGRDRKRKYTRV
jgi:hypothetical protein